MDHVVYVDTKAKELVKILAGDVTMIIRGAAGRKMPYGRVNQDDVLFLIQNDGSGQVRAKARVVSVFNSEKMTREESTALVGANMGKLVLTKAQFKRWAGKRYLVLIEIGEAESISTFGVDKSGYGNMDDWLPVGDIRSVGFYP